jgi:hypothetical protein
VQYVGERPTSSWALLATVPCANDRHKPYLCCLLNTELHAVYYVLDWVCGLLFNERLEDFPEQRVQLVLCLQIARHQGPKVR